MLEVGSLLDGKYRILNEVGHGGMSVVYLAVNERANKTWAVKEVRKDGGNDWSVVSQGLIAETEMLKKLNHPNLPSIIDVIDQDDSFIIVMEKKKKKSLQALLDVEGPQPADKVIEWSKQLCNVLGYLHSRRPPIIYRDMKPANVMLRPTGDVTLIDFGTAREYKESTNEDTTWLGTRGYAAPEQFGGRGQTDARTDIYTLGATMYHLITGYSPADTNFVIHPIGEFLPDLKGSGIERIILKCCQPNPGDRYQSCAELLYALEHVHDEDCRSKKRIQKPVDLLNGIRNSFFIPKKTSYVDFDKGYQVFISYKNTDEFGKETPDTKLAEGLYKKLRAKGIKIFFSKESIYEEASDKYKNSISNALNESRILVVVGTCKEYMNSPWVRREFIEFRSKMKKAKSADEFAIFTYRGIGMHVNSLPKELKDYTSSTDADKLKNMIISRLAGTGRQSDMPTELRAEAVWEQVQPGAKIAKRYQLYKCIKTGQYYKLFEAADLNVNNALRLVKVINNYLIQEGTQDPEIECLKLLSDVSKGIPSIYDFGKDEEITYLVTSFPHGTRLDQLMKNGTIDESMAIRWMLDLCDILEHLHSHDPRVIHCNIKPPNIYIDNGNAELINFSAAYVDGWPSKSRGRVKESNYKAPELTTSFLINKKPEPSADIYAVGYTIKEILTGGGTVGYNKYKQHKISRGLSYILRKCTCIEPSERYQNVIELKHDLENINAVAIKAMAVGTYKSIKALFNTDKKKVGHGTSAPVPSGFEHSYPPAFDSSSLRPDIYLSRDGFGETTILGNYNPDMDMGETTILGPSNPDLD